MSSPCPPYHCLWRSSCCSTRSVITGIDAGSQRLPAMIGNQFPRVLVLGAHVHPDPLLLEEPNRFSPDARGDHLGNPFLRKLRGQQPRFMRRGCQPCLVLYSSIFRFDDSKLFTMSKMTAKFPLFHGYRDNLFHLMPLLQDPSLLLILLLRDRKSTRLNSSHVRISYAVF